MENRTSSSSVSGPQDQASNQDELFMQQSLLFSDTIKDLKNLRQQLVVEILKDYAIKALINSIDHLGSVAYTVNSFSNEKISQVSTLELRFSCLEQCREGHSRLQSPQFSSRQETFTFSSTWINERSDKRAGSPLRFPLTCSGSLLPKRAISLNNTNANRRYLSEPRRSIPFSTYLERDGANEVEQYSNKSKRLLKALLSMRKSRKDHRLYKYLDETLNKLEAWQQPERPLQLHISPS
ncbi:protein ABIL3-like [Hevea brasiliensis]|uniref:protein ABIL3-like n=1 Tax=Hevea brasiliensis TaxID=3981 RepID=UPI0025E59EB0|nr:protein ABIL3-like [Hevea brasiliensis]